MQEFSSTQEDTLREDSKVESSTKSGKINNDDSQSDDRKSDDETDATTTTEFDVHQKGAILSLQNLIKLKRKVRKSKKITVDLSNTKYDVIKQICGDSFNWNITYRTNGDWNIRWQDFYINEDDLRRMLPYQKINHFPGSYNLGKKNYLGKNLSKMRLKFPDDFDFCPRTWLLPYQYEDLRNFYEKNKTKKPVFIVKPEASCQGKGIYLVKKFSTLKQDQHMVVQEYIKHPLLIDGLKFDFRVYVLVKSVCPLKVFIYREGLARFATCKYSKPSKKNLRNMCMHLTNYAVNKHNPEFQFNSNAEQDNIGHKRSFSSILKYLEDNGKDANYVFLQIKQIVNKTMCSVQPYLSHLYRSCQLKEENSEMCFEVFGFDVMLDEDLKAYLIEVNHTPSFTTDTPLDYHIKHSLITDTLILVDTRSKAKTTYTDSKKQMIVGKSNVRMNQDEKETLTRKLDAYEYKHQNGYIKSLPASDDDPLNYEKFIQAAQSIHDEFTGTKRNTDRLTTLNQPSSTSLQQTEKKKSEADTPTIPKARNSNIIRRPVSGIPLNLQKKVNKDLMNGEGEVQKAANNTNGFLNQSFNSQNQPVPVNGYQPCAPGPQAQAQGNSSSSSSIQTVTAMSQKSNTNHIIKNIRKISQKYGYKPSQSVADQSIDGFTTGSSTNVYLGGLNKNQNAISQMNNYSREEFSMMNLDKADQLKQFASNNNLQYQVRPESGRQELSFKLDQLKRELQMAKEEATRCINEQESLKIQQIPTIPRGYNSISENSNTLGQIKFGASQRPQSSSITGQVYRGSVNLASQNSMNGTTALPLASSRPYIQSGNKTLIVKVKDDPVMRNNGNQNGTIVYIPSLNNNGNNLQQNRNEFLSIQRAKIEPKLYSNQGLGIGNQNSNTTYLTPLTSGGSNRGINTASLHGYSGNQNLIGGNNNNAYLNGISPKHYQNSVTPSSQQFGATNSLNILQDMGNKNMNLLVENKEKSNYKTRGNSSIGGQRDLKPQSNQNQYGFQQPNNVSSANNNNNSNNNNNNNANNNNQFANQPQMSSYSNLRSNSYGNLHNEKGYVLTVENAQTTTNATNYAQRKGLPMRTFKFDDKISNLIKFNIEDEIQS